MYESSVAQHFAERGIRQGIEQGERKRGIEALLDVLEIRFDPNAVAPLKPNIEAIDDLQTLKWLLRSAVQVTGLGEFKQILDSLSQS